MSKRRTRWRLVQAWIWTSYKCSKPTRRTCRDDTSMPFTGYLTLHPVGGLTSRLLFRSSLSTDRSKTQLLCLRGAVWGPLLMRRGTGVAVEQLRARLRERVARNVGAAGASFAFAVRTCARGAACNRRMWSEIRGPARQRVGRRKSHSWWREAARRGRWWRGRSGRRSFG